VSALDVARFIDSELDETRRAEIAAKSRPRDRRLVGAEPVKRDLDEHGTVEEATRWIATMVG
jgi:hypothetical protein